LEMRVLGGGPQPQPRAKDKGATVRRDPKEVRGKMYERTEHEPGTEVVILDSPSSLGFFE